MKKLLFSFVLLVFISFTASAQDVAKPSVNQNSAEITFDKTVHDYGTVYQEGNGTCEFKFTNTGKEPLILSKPLSSCGCTVPTWPQEPILPGKSDVIKVTYNTKSIGPINKTVTVNSNAKTSRVVLQIKGNVVAKPATAEPVKTTSQGSPVNK
jgi:hypothetical protein